MSTTSLNKIQNTNGRQRTTSISKQTQQHQKTQQYQQSQKQIKKVQKVQTRQTIKTTTITSAKNLPPLPDRKYTSEQRNIIKQEQAFATKYSQVRRRSQSKRPSSVSSIRSNGSFSQKCERESKTFQQTIGEKISEFLKRYIFKNLQKEQLLANVQPIKLDNSHYIGSFVDGKRSGKGIQRFNSREKNGDVYIGEWIQDNYYKGIYYSKSSNVFYEGQWINKKLNGKVTLMKQNKDKYTGEGYLKEGFFVINGQGQYFYYDKNQYYEGAWVEGKRHGKGTYIYKSKDKYVGNWKNDQRDDTNGQIIYYQLEKQIGRFKGCFKQDNINGEGELKYKDQIYIGQWKDGMKHGKGKMTFSNGDVYDGEFKNDTFKGKGKYVFKQGKRVYDGYFENGRPDNSGCYQIGSTKYEGQWKDGRKKGKGKMTFSSGQYYQGQWYEKKTGQGTYQWQNGDIFKGSFLQGKLDGTGQYIWKNSQCCLNGRWKDNKPNGQFQFIDEKKEKFYFTISNGQILFKNSVSAQ